MNDCNICGKNAEWGDGIDRYCKDHQPLIEAEEQSYSGDNGIRCFQTTSSINRGRRCLAPATGYCTRRNKPFPLCARHVKLLANQGVNIAPIGNTGSIAFLEIQLIDAVRKRR